MSQPNEIFTFCVKAMNVSLFPPNIEINRRVAAAMMPPEGMEEGAKPSPKGGKASSGSSQCSSKKGMAAGYCTKARHIVEFTAKKEFPRCACPP